MHNFNNFIVKIQLQNLVLTNMCICDLMIINKYVAEWSSSVARRAHNPKVDGSNPSSATSEALDLIRAIGFSAIFIFYRPRLRLLCPL